MSLSDVRDGTHSSPEYVAKGYPFITSKNLNDDGTIDFSNLNYITSKDYEDFSRRSKPNKGDILFGMIGTIGKPVLISTDIEFAIKNVALIKEKKLLLNRYLIDKLSSNSILNQFMKNKDGGTQQFISLGNIRKLLIKYPSLEEQNKIANFFELIKERIQTQNKIIEDLEITKKNILRKIFCKRGQMSIGDEIKIGNYLIPGSKEPINPNDYRRITVHLNYGGLSFSEPDREMKDTRPFYLRKSGELIIGKQNYFNGSICIVPNEFDNTVCSNAIMSFEIKNINPVFLLYAISNEDYLKARAFYANGTGQKELSEKAFLNFSIKVPDNKKQDLIANLLEKVEAKLNLERRILNNYSIEKEYFLRELFI